MEHIKFLSVFLVCCSLYSNCFAEAAPAALAVDPTLVFFTSLSTCTPGDYSEQNDLSVELGQSYLKQQIINLDNDICNVKLSTPDNRIMTCAFPMAQISNLTDQHFLQGILQGTTNTDQEGINAESLWSRLKTNYCTFDSH